MELLANDDGGGGCHNGLCAEICILGCLAMGGLSITVGGMMGLAAMWNITGAD